MMAKMTGLVAATLVLAIAGADNAENNTNRARRDTIPAEMKQWKILMEFDGGGTRDERRRLGWHVMTVSSDGDFTVTQKIGGQNSPHTWKRDEGKLDAEELRSVFSAARDLVNDFKLTEKQASEFTYDGRAFVLRISSNWSTVGIEKNEMKAYSDAGEQTKDLIDLINSRLVNVSQIR